MQTNTEIKEQKEVEKVADNLEGVSFSGGNELGEAVQDVTPEKKGILAKILQLFKKKSSSANNK